MQTPWDQPLLRLRVNLHVECVDCAGALIFSSVHISRLYCMIIGFVVKIKTKSGVYIYKASLSYLIGLHGLLVFHFTLPLIASS